MIYRSAALTATRVRIAFGIRNTIDLGCPRDRARDHCCRTHPTRRFESRDGEGLLMRKLPHFVGMEACLVAMHSRSPLAQTRARFRSVFAHIFYLVEKTVPRV